MLKFDFLKKNLELASSPQVIYDFWRNVFHMLYSITEQISLYGCFYFFELLGNMYIVIIGPQPLSS